MGIVINWEETVGNTLSEVTDYEEVELTGAEYEELYKVVENNLKHYDDIDNANIEGAINRFLIGKGYTYNDDDCAWEIGQ